MEALQNRRTWVGGGVVLAIVLIAASWLMLIHPRLADASSLRSAASSADTQNFVLQSKVNRLRKQNEKIGELRSTIRSDLAQLPLDSGLPDFTRQISAQAGANGVSITSLAIGSIAPTAAGSTNSVYTIQVTLISTGSLTRQLAFLDDVQVDGPRRALVSSTQFSSGSGGTAGSIDADTTLTTQLTIFSAPVSPATQAQLEKELSGDTSS
jgi:Tfp pilus assembly protein PilO